MVVSLTVKTGVTDICHGKQLQYHNIASYLWDNVNFICDNDKYKK